MTAADTGLQSSYTASDTCIVFWSFGVRFWWFFAGIPRRQYLERSKCTSAWGQHRWTEGYHTPAPCIQIVNNILYHAYCTCISYIIRNHGLTGTWRSGTKLPEIRTPGHARITCEIYATINAAMHCGFCMYRPTVWAKNEANARFRLYLSNALTDSNYFWHT